MSLILLPQALILVILKFLSSHALSKASTFSSGEIGPSEKSEGTERIVGAGMGRAGMSEDAALGQAVELEETWLPTLYSRSSSTLTAPPVASCSS